MKTIVKYSLSLFAAALLLGACLCFAAFAAPLPGQLVLPVADLAVPTVPDGKIGATEYGAAEPLMRLTNGSGLRAADAEGQPLTEGLPATSICISRKRARPCSSGSSCGKTHTRATTTA